MTRRRHGFVLSTLLAACAPDDIGIAVQQPEIDVTPSPLGFGPSAVPLVHILPLHVSNAGHADLEVSIRLEGDDGHVFELAETGLTLGPGEEHPVDVRFTPTTFLDYAATVVLTSNDLTDPELRVPLSGTGISAPLPDIDVDALSIDFGDGTTPVTRLLTVTNTGSAPLHLGTLSQSGSSAFSLLSDPSGNTVAPGDDVVVVLTYAPSTTEGDSGTLVLPSDDPDEDPVTIVLLGNGGADFEYPVAVIDCPGQTDPPAFVQLDGDASFDPAGHTPLTYAWTLASVPTDNAGEPISSGYLTNAVDRTTRLWADAVGPYEVDLVVTNAIGVASAPARCLIDAIPSERVHVELTWNTGSADLDLHLALDGAPVFARPDDANWCNRTPGWGAPGTADDPRLDLDDRGGHGPENINIDEPADGRYDVRVHYFDDQGDDVVTASVRVYLDGALAFQASQNLSRNDVWEVARINWPEATAGALSTPVAGAVHRQCYTP